VSGIELAAERLKSGLRNMAIWDQFPLLLDLRREKTSSSAPSVSALHSGNLGDIIYALPTCYLLGVNHLVLNVCTDPAFGGRILTDQAAKSLAPLLLAQRNIERVTVVKSNVPWEYAQPSDIGVDYILDGFRAYGSVKNLHLVYQHAAPYKLNVDASKPWLSVPKSATNHVPRKPFLVVGLTARYRRYERDYYEKLLCDIPPEFIYFVGLPVDQIQRLGLPGEVYQTDDFAALAAFIQKAVFFIGNPSFPYALAEGLKVPRFVELPLECNVYPLGDNGYPLHMYSVEYLRNKLLTELGLVHHPSVEIAALAKEKKELHSMMVKLKVELEEAQRANSRLAKESEEWGVDKSGLESRVRELEAALEQAVKEKEALKTQLVKQSASYESTRLALEQAVKEKEALKTQLVKESASYESTRLGLEGVLNSWSWRVTAPLRWLKNEPVLAARGAYRIVKLVACCCWVYRWKLPEYVRLARARAVIAASGLFDAAYYLKRYPDVARAGFDPIVHYIIAGSKEGRDPHPLFRTSFYLKENRDCVEKGLNPLLHFIQEGAKRRLKPHPLFDTAYYLAKYPEVVASGLNPLRHYLLYGAAKRLNPNAWFAADYYLNTNPDVCRAGVNPLLHFVLNGAAEGRNPHPKFNVLDYYKKHPSLLISSLNPLEHFLSSVSAPPPVLSPGRKGAPCGLTFEELKLGGPAAEPVPADAPLLPYVAHFFPAEPRAGNELRMHRLLKWLRLQGYRPLMVLAPLGEEHYSHDELSKLAAVCPDFLLVYRDGKVLSSPQAARLMSPLGGEFLVRDYGRVLGDELLSEPEAREALEMEKNFCFDALMALMLAVQKRIKPQAVLVNYVFMTRFFPLLPAEVFKILDTHDLFSAVKEKVASFGAIKTLGLSAAEEKRRLARADLILAIQSEEEAEIRVMVPEKKIITVGVDFETHMLPPGSGKTVLFVASDNPRNVHGVQGFLRFAWPRVLKAVPDASFLVGGRVAAAVKEHAFLLERVELCGELEDVTPLYKQARVVINPVLAGTGLKIKTLEALSNFRPLVAWPSGVEGLERKLRGYCLVARDWFEFADRVLMVLQDPKEEWFSSSDRAVITHHLSAGHVYSDLKRELVRVFGSSRGINGAEKGKGGNV